MGTVFAASYLASSRDFITFCWSLKSNPPLQICKIISFVVITGFSSWAMEFLILRFTLDCFMQSYEI